MPVKIFWYMPERVVYTKITGVLTIEQMRDGNLFNVKLMNKTNHNLAVYFIVDSHDMRWQA